MKVLVTWRANAEEIAAIRRHIPEDTELVYAPARPYLGRYNCDPEDMATLARDVDAIFGWAPIPDEVVASAANLKFIGWLHAGCDQLNFPLLRARGVQVS